MNHRRLPRTIAHLRSGFSLMEVLLATAILMGSVVVLGELAGIGRRQAQRGRELAEAQQRCELLLNEILLGLRPLIAIEQEPLIDPLETAEIVETLDFASQTDLFDEYDPFAPESVSTRDSAVDTSTLDEQPDWLYSLRLEPLANRPGLALLTLSVEQSPENFPRPVRFELSRWIEDPSPPDRDLNRAFGAPQGLTATNAGRLP